MKRIKTQDIEIFQAENGIYYYRGTPDGEKDQIERSLKTDNFIKARQNKKKLLSDIREAGLAALTNKVSPLFKRYISERSEELKRGELGERTLYEINDIFKRFIDPFFGNMKLDDVDTYQFKRYCVKFGNRDYTNHRKVLTTFLHWCKSQRLIRGVPEFELPEWDKRQRMVLTETEIKGLLSHAHGNLLLYVAMYLFMGLRNKEIIKLEWERLDLERGALILRKTDTKTKRPRELPINPFVWDLLKTRKASSKGRWVFPNKRLKAKTGHMSLQGFNNEWPRLLKRAGIIRQITPHDLRATWERFTHMNPNFTDTQREKMAGAKIEVQRRDYVTLTADDLRGLESAVQFNGLAEILSAKSVGESAGENQSKESRNSDKSA